MRLPIEKELSAFYTIYKLSSPLMDLSNTNIGFKNWWPVGVPSNDDTIQLDGNGHQANLINIQSLNK